MKPGDKAILARRQLALLRGEITQPTSPRVFAQGTATAAMKVNPYDHLVRDFQRKQEGLRLIEESRKARAAADESSREIEEGLQVVRRRG